MRQIARYDKDIKGLLWTKKNIYEHNAYHLSILISAPYDSFVRHTPWALAILLLCTPWPDVRAQYDDHEEEEKHYQKRLARPTPPPVKLESIVSAADRLIGDS